MKKLTFLFLFAVNLLWSQYDYMLMASRQQWEAANSVTYTDTPVARYYALYGASGGNWVPTGGGIPFIKVGSNTYNDGTFSVSGNGTFENGRPPTGIHSSVPDYLTLSDAQTYMTGEAWDDYSLQFSGLESGANYKVRLYLQNSYYGTDQVGERVFDILVNGTLVDDNLDLVAVFGDDILGMREYEVNNLSGTTITVASADVVENPLWNGIELIKVVASGGEEPSNIDPTIDQGDLITYATADEELGTQGTAISSVQDLKGVNDGIATNITLDVDNGSKYYDYGTGASINLGSSSDFDFDGSTDSFSIMTVIHKEGTAAYWNTLFGKGYDNSPTRQLYITVYDSSPPRAFIVVGGDTGHVDLEMNTQPNEQDWVFIVTSDTQYLKVYANGNKIFESNLDQFDGNVKSAADFMIGARRHLSDSDTSENFTERMKAYAVWNDDLTESEIVAIQQHFRPTSTNLYGDFVGSKDYPSSTNNNWLNWDGATNSVETTEVYSGTTALRVGGNKGTSEAYQSSYWNGNVSVGDIAVIRGYAKIITPSAAVDDNGNTQNIQMYDSTGTPMGRSVVLDQTNTTSWQYFEIQRKVLNASTDNIYTLVRAGTGVIILDDIEMFIAD